MPILVAGPARIPTSSPGFWSTLPARATQTRALMVAVRDSRGSSPSELCVWLASSTAPRSSRPQWRKIGQSGLAVGAVSGPPFYRASPPPTPRHPRTSLVCRGDQLDVRPIHGQTADKGSDNSSLKSCILIDAGPRGPLPPCLFQGPRCGWMSCRHAGLHSGPRSGDGVIDMTAPPCQARPSSRTRGAGRKVGHMCLVPCHEVSNLRPMGFVASFGSEQNSALAFSVSTPPSPVGEGPSARPHGHFVPLRGKASWGLAEAALCGQAESRAGSGRGWAVAR